MWGHLNILLIFGILAISLSMDATQVWGKATEGMTDAGLITPRKEKIEGRDGQWTKQIFGPEIADRPYVIGPLYYTRLCSNGAQDDWIGETGVDCGGEHCDACQSGTFYISNI